MPTSDSHDYELIDRLAEEFAERFRNGDRPGVQEYCDKYPHVAADLRGMLPAMAEVEQSELRLFCFHRFLAAIFGVHRVPVMEYNGGITLTGDDP